MIPTFHWVIKRTNQEIDDVFAKPELSHGAIS
jgi:hypothetical protein